MSLEKFLEYLEYRIKINQSLQLWTIADHVCFKKTHRAIEQGFLNWQSDTRIISYDCGELHNFDEVDR